MSRGQSTFFVLLLTWFWLCGGPALARAATAQLDPDQSSLEGSPLSGRIGLEVGDGPPGGNRSFDVTRVAITGGGLSVGIDDRLANPGLGLLRSDGSFIVPALFVVVEGLGDALALTILDLVGTYGPSSACAGGVPCLETAFQIDTGSAEGILDVAIVAAVPEPGTALLVALGLGGTALARRRRVIR